MYPFQFIRSSLFANTRCRVVQNKIEQINIVKYINMNINATGLNGIYLS